MSVPDPSSFSRRERQIMEVLYRRGKATAKEIQAELPEPPSYSAVRALLVILEEKGGVVHDREGRRYVYRPTVAQPRAKRGALRSVMKTFFEGSPEKLVAALLDPKDQQLSEAEIDRIKALIEQSGDGANS
jgi:predicted transcriptional regulator